MAVVRHRGVHVAELRLGHPLQRGRQEEWQEDALLLEEGAYACE